MSASTSGGYNPMRGCNLADCMMGFRVRACAQPWFELTFDGLARIEGHSSGGRTGGGGSQGVPDAEGASKLGKDQSCSGVGVLKV